MIFNETVNKKTQFTSPLYIYKAHFLLKVISVSLSLNYPALFSLNLWKKSWKRLVIMIFNETVNKKTQFTSPLYIYKAHFLLKVISVSLSLNYPALFSLNLWKKSWKRLVIMIFRETVNKKTQFTSPVYICKAHFLVRYLFFISVSVAQFQ